MNSDQDFYQTEPSTKDLIEEFKYKVKPTQTHKDLLKAIEAYYKENEKFMIKHNLEAGRRARKSLLEIYKMITVRRAEISDIIYRENKEQ